MLAKAEAGTNGKRWSSAKLRAEIALLPKKTRTPRPGGGKVVDRATARARITDLWTKEREAHQEALKKQEAKIQKELDKLSPEDKRKEASSLQLSHILERFNMIAAFMADKNVDEIIDAARIEAKQDIQRRAEIKNTSDKIDAIRPFEDGLKTLNSELEAELGNQSAKAA